MSDEMIYGARSQFCSCFISFATPDDPFARKLFVDLQSRGVRCWFAPESMPIGADISDEIEREIIVHDRLIVVLSKDSIHSAWVEGEVKKAVSKERSGGRSIAAPIQLDDLVSGPAPIWVTTLRERRNVGDFRRWTDSTLYNSALERLIRDLRKASVSGATGRSAGCY